MKIFGGKENLPVLLIQVKDGAGCAGSNKWQMEIALIISVAVGNERFTDVQEIIPGITPKVIAKELKETGRA